MENKTVEITVERLKELEELEKFINDISHSQLPIPDGAESVSSYIKRLAGEVDKLRIRSTRAIISNATYNSAVLGRKEFRKLYREAKAEVERLAGEVERLVEYIEFLNKANEGPILTAATHGWECPEEDIKKGKELRAKITHLTDKV